ncbi:hypothetical protein theurythT_17300 [Thalassotalea eurytherma]|uniref:Uncharacterized protein n=1 Tax=Thalassotalea eurytherma TaxID=1144278 RepID=A0ABQ6H249_9GAMM|nr:hypothetical protein theurythT_17300 [Thalassotalea eurytherma]
MQLIELVTYTNFQNLPHSLNLYSLLFVND